MGKNRADVPPSSLLQTQQNHVQIRNTNPERVGWERIVYGTQQNRLWLVSCLLFTIFQSKGKINWSKPLLKRKVILTMVVSTGLIKSVLEFFHANRLTMPVNEWLLLNLPDLPINKGEGLREKVTQAVPSFVLQVRNGLGWDVSTSS